MPPAPARARPHLLVVELWGLGDLTFAIPFLRAALRCFEVTLLAKAHARALLEPTFPELRFIPFDAPWTAFRGKYRLWQWPHALLLRLVARLRRERFDAAVSVRADPRDHALLWLAGARRRLGFPSRGSAALLTDLVGRSPRKQHRTEDWRQLGRALGLAGIDGEQLPFLDHGRYRSALGDRLFPARPLPVLCLHTGSRIPVRRWPPASYAALIGKLRRRFRFHLLLITDPDGSGSELTPLADTIAPALTLGELVDVLGRADLVLCNDSGPMHIAAACGRPVIAFFGPADPDWFRPWGESHHVVIRDICPLRPCSDYCRFPEPYCLTRMSADEVYPEIEDHLLHLAATGVMPRILPSSSG